ncbi:MAG: hypothetical protein QOD57_4894, partial [Actinomycetota bacterium]|nr:hypothetical protein [Actinomycetota bacterium]
MTMTSDAQGSATSVPPAPASAS